ncbi:monoterpene synthase 8, chloroplastic [Musa acuminata AAA Group]|uniref:monoterpene synthase 8, chloroplastic n=1 Tax=Musa acuminata AAA Group TaxID=214697 RepID=UPI0031D24F03
MAFCSSAPSCCSLIGAYPRTAPSKSSPRRCLLLPIRCTARTPPPPRRSADYQPSSWSDEYIQSLTTDTKVEEDTATRMEKLTEDVKLLIYMKKGIEEQLQLIDHLQQLGVAYHFKEDIKDALWTIYGSMEEVSMLLKDNLHATALMFRLLREHGFAVSEGVFNRFMDEMGNLKANLRHQTEGLVSLYEAFHLAKEGEHLLEEAINFTTKQLKSLMGESLEPHLREHVTHSLELPLNWRMPRLQTRWFIEACQREAKMNPVLLELAKLDFNRVQIIYQRELREVSRYFELALLESCLVHSALVYELANFSTNLWLSIRWWSNLGLAQRLPFSRDRLMENYFWTVGWAFEPQFARFREAQTKANCLITTIDDVYDVYGTIDELELFTDAVERWDVNTMDKLPEYMKICFLALFNTTNDTAYNVMKEKGLDIIPHLKKAWADLCKAYMVEARWYHQGYTPNLEEYLENALVSISGPLATTLAYCTSDDVTREALDGFQICPEIARWSSMIFRLCNDLGTSKDELRRGDVPKSIECHMHESGVSEDAAREHIRRLIRGNWRAINGDRSFTSRFEENLKMIAINIPRMAHCMYQYGDGYGKPDGVIEDRMRSLLIEPILM